MSEKKSLLLGALLGGIAAGATMYVLKTENGQAMKKLRFWCCRVIRIWCMLRVKTAPMIITAPSN